MGHIYTTHLEIYADLARKYKNATFDEYSILEWCMQVETRHIKDVETMPDFIKIPLQVTCQGTVLLPCNIFRILDVYDNAGNIVTAQNNGSYLYGLTDKYGNSSFIEGDTIYINYKGIMIDSNTGIPMILQGHENACETFCKIQIFEEDAVTGKFNMNIWNIWKDEFHGQVSAAKYNYRQKTRAKLHEIANIHGNALAHIGGMKLYHTLYNDKTL